MTRYGTIAVRNGTGHRRLLACCALAHLLVLVTVVVGAVLLGRTLVVADLGPLWVAAVVLAGVVAAAAGQLLLLRSALVARSTISAGAANADLLARVPQAVVVGASVVVVGMFGIVSIAQFPVAPLAVRLVMGVPVLAPGIALLQLVTVYRCLSGPGYRVAGVEPGGPCRYLPPGTGAGRRSAQRIFVGGSLLLMAMAGGQVAIGTLLAPEGAGLTATVAATAAIVVLLPVVGSAVLARRAIVGDRVELALLHRAAGVLVAAGRALPAVPVVVVLAFDPGAGPLAALVYMVLALAVLAAVQQLAELCTLYLGRIPPRRGLFADRRR